MNKKQFLEAIRNRIKGLPEHDIDKSLDYYSEMIDDRVEDGMTEEEAVAALGTVDEIVTQILNDIPLPKLVKEKVSPKRSLSAWEILLLVLGFPLWFPLLISFASIILSAYIVLWSVVISLYAVNFAVLVSGLACIAAGVLFFITAKPVPAIAIMGMGFLCLGLGILLLFLFNLITIGVVKLSKLIILEIKHLFVGRREDNE